MAGEELQHNNQSREEAREKLIIQLGWLGFAMAVDGGTAAQTQQPTDESIREETDRVCVASGRGKGSKHTATSQKRGVAVDSQLCCYVDIYITVKLNDITTRNFTIACINI
jgi:hypothetical protein